MTRDVLVDGYTLFVGDPDRAGVSSDDDGGLYYRDTRHLSTLLMAVEGVDLATVGRDLTGANRRTVVSTDGTATVNRVDEREEKRSDVVVRTTQSVSGDGLCQRVRLTNHSAVPFSGTASVGFDADFADVFEVRGFASQLDREPTVRVGDRSVSFAYGYETVADDPVTRRTTVRFEREPTTLEPARAAFDVDLAPQEETTIRFLVRPEISRGTATSNGGFARPDDSLAFEATRDPLSVDVPTVSTGRGDFDRVFARASEDLGALTAETDHGPVPLAGAPWFATVFGRDALIAAYQALPVAPALASGTLRYLAAHQGTTVDDAREEEPGKMFHEIREGELALRGRVPHSPYYGSVDATPLWVVLLAELHRWTGEDDLVAELADALEGAISWIDRARAQYGDDPFVYYEESPTMGLLHKAWRDTPGSVQFPDGRPAAPPIASVEVQAYVYRALRDAATLYESVLDEPLRATDLREEADRLAEAFDETFWLPEADYFGVAKDGDGATVPTLTSNVGHCLWSGIVREDRARAVASSLQSDELFTGWGVRTMSTETAGYSPISYHLGSVWPHDTSLAALGLARYGLYEDANRLTRAVMGACTHFEDRRIPELFCGFADDLAPKPYASSCVPQAWSAGAPYALLRATFDLQPTEDGVAVGNDDAVLEPSALDPIQDRWTD